ncbi:ABC-type sodium efflux pump system, permease component [Thermococcus onnurineus NA1]|uniref:ABC-type sodium efflux pump system, permease component n=1 Tax=Thermococcus onnurineus (strain NA1) TaxID=523850 RepID=B6YXM4_THEON|nr:MULTISPECIES: ABC transporter permease [Thermococcus]ACJ16837.1 ABC-type sodium efflux pump system, permease component [Thermococcus onnurineus NA1]NJE46817.1 ABC transporter permease [Thermococcus sp. GR7]NJE78314.1 ABC transporter permease [Thermococcus sp. GR4]NJF23389.1 ABC transporter permease [Thermococcus sp. GR5]
MSDFWVMAKKELRNLFRDRKLIFGLVVIPLILFPVMGKVITLGLEQAQGETKVAIVDFDEGGYGEVLIKALEVTPNITVAVINATSLDEALQKAVLEKQNVLVVIPPDFSTRLEENEKATVQIYGIFTTIGAGIKESVSEGRINAVIGVLSDGIARIKIEQLGAGNPDAILRPIETESKSVIRGKIVDIQPSIVSNVIASQAFSIPMIVFLMVMVTAQMAAGAMAAEKENKTLETLLTLPVARTKIVGAKIFGTAVMGLMAAIAYMIGMRSYLGSFGLGATGITLEDIGLSVTPMGMLLFALVVFLTIIFSLSLAMILAIFAEDVQSATTVVSAVIMPLAFPAFLLMYTDISDLPVAIKYVLLAIPFTHPIVDYRYILLGDYGSVFLSVGYLALMAGLTLYVTAWIFSTEKVMTAKISWGRKKMG